MIVYIVMLSQLFFSHMHMCIFVGIKLQLEESIRDTKIKERVKSKLSQEFSVSSVSAAYH